MVNTSKLAGVPASSVFSPLTIDSYIFVRPSTSSLLTVKSDDVEGRTKIYESMVKGENSLEAGTPASFDVLTNEIRGLALNMQLEKSRI